MEVMEENVFSLGYVHQMFRVKNLNSCKLYSHGLADQKRYVWVDR